MRTDVDPRLTDAALALAVALVLAVVIAADPAGRASAPAYGFAVFFGALLLVRRRAPRLVLVLTLIAVFGYYILDLPPVGMVLPATGALFSAAEQRRTPWAVGAAAVLLAVATFFRLIDDAPEAGLNGYTFVTEVALAAAAIALGAAVRLTREARERTARIAELTAAEQQRAADARLQEERLRMARDLHDTIGHTLSVAALHAGVATEAEDAAASRRALGRVRQATSDALRELRRTVKILRSDRAPDQAPVLGLAAVDPLLTVARDSGLRVVTEMAVPSDALAPSVDAAAYRIVQESVTNILRHADARTLRLRARVVDGILSLEISDDGSLGREPVGEGSGIRGMRERAELLGGRLTARPAPGGFLVEARIPVDGEETR
ncbi:sensor histidine kinase [Microbacterium sp. CIAB417]|uniref:sensor histidine kinase n=1 Tax=Microbacterium sp. CIAB417 TaxID=2860287 RepID=UPI001FAE4996|nr:sensor histidine kinase [Microbacterium sp. CIAB417]